MQQRWVFAVMGSLAVINAFAMRICLSMAIMGMVEPREKSSNQTSDDACPSFGASTISLKSSGGGIYEWDEYTQGIILSSFYWGYMLTQIPGGLWSARFGGKYILGLGILSTGIFTLLTPIVVVAYGSTGLILFRFLMGIGEGTTLPAVSAMIGQWAPPQERTVISTIVISGAPIGTVLGNALSGVLMQYSSIGWPLVFYFFGACAVVWFFAWVLLCYSYPEGHPFISEDEKKYLRKAMSQHTQRHKQPTPWRQIMSSGPGWGMLAGHVGFAWSTFTMISDLPKYMSNVLKFSIQTNGFLSALPHVSIWVVSNVSSWLADWLIKRRTMSRTTVRKVLSSTAAMLSSLFFVIASYAGCDRTIVVIFFTVGMSTMGFYYSSLMVNPNDLSPNYSGTLMAFVGTSASITGTLAPYVVGVLTPHQTLSEWRIVFWIAAVIACGSSVIFAIWGDGEVQPWNNLEPQGQEKITIKNETASTTVYSAGAEESGRRYSRLDIDTQNVIS